MSTAHQGVTAVSKDKFTVFGCHSDSAKAVFLTGSFNNWSPTATPMAKNDTGHWSVSLPLAPGHYEYKFVVDGEWICEPGCTYKEVHCAVNEFGTMNRVLEVQ